MNLRNSIWFTGLWLYVFVLLIIHLVFPYLAQSVEEFFTIKESWLWLGAILIPLRITCTNFKRYKRGFTDFGFKDALGINITQHNYSSERFQAMYPSVSPKLISKRPRNLVLGKNGKNYISSPIKEDGVNIFTIGNIGSGKSVMLLNFLYLNLYNMIQSGKDSALNWALIDIKGELYQKLLGISEKDYFAGCNPIVHVVQPSNRKSYGWDVFYRIHRTDRPVTETDRLKAVTDIADALVCKDGDKPYFHENAIKIMTGILLFYSYKNWDFIPIIQKISRTTFDELLNTIVEEAESEGYSIVLDKLKSFTGKPDNESLQDIEATMKTYLSCFSYPDVIYALHDNPNRISCDILNDGISCIDIAIEEHMLLTYQPLFRLLTIQTLRHAESEFHESDSRKTMIIVDEAARVGEISGLDSAMATLRSRHTSIWLLYQSLSQYRDIVSKEKAATLLNLCELKIFLSGSGDKDTTDYVSHMVGDYTEESISYSKGGFLGGSKEAKYSQQKRPVIDGRSMMELREKDEMIAFIYGHYYRFKKIMYFKNPYYQKIVQEIRAYFESQKHKKEE